MQRACAAAGRPCMSAGHRSEGWAAARDADLEAACSAARPELGCRLHALCQLLHARECLQSRGRCRSAAGSAKNAAQLKGPGQGLSGGMQPCFPWQIMHENQE